MGGANPKYPNYKKRNGKIKKWHVAGHSEAELERSFQVAVAWKKQEEKEGKAVKPKAKPEQRKRRSQFSP